MRAAHSLTLTFFIAATACSSSSENRGMDEPTGGDASREVSTDGGTSDAELSPEESVDAGSGVTWTALYRDLFGPTAQSGCAGSGACHGAASESGALVSNGYVCATQQGCRESILSLETGLVQSRDFAAPSKSTLVLVLRRRDANGTIKGAMPKASPYEIGRAHV